MSQSTITALFLTKSSKVEDGDVTTLNEKRILSADLGTDDILAHGIAENNSMEATNEKPMEHHDAKSRDDGRASSKNITEINRDFPEKTTPDKHKQQVDMASPQKQCNQTTQDSTNMRQIPETTQPSLETTSSKTSRPISSSSCDVIQRDGLSPNESFEEIPTLKSTITRQDVSQKSEKQQRQELHGSHDRSPEKRPESSEAIFQADRHEVSNGHDNMQNQGWENRPKHQLYGYQEPEKKITHTQHRASATPNRPGLHHKHSQTSLSPSSSSSSDDKIHSQTSSVAVDTAAGSCRCSFSDSSSLPSRRPRRKRRHLIRRYRRRKSSRRLSLVIEKKKHNHDEVKLFTVGILQICAGAISIPLGIANFYIERVAGKYDFPPSGIWCGIIFILTGAQAVITSRYPSRTKAFVGLILSVISSISSIAVEVIEAISATKQAKCSQGKPSTENTLLCLETIFALHITLCGVVFTEIVISGVHIYYGFQVSKHQKSEKEVTTALKALKFVDIS